MSRVGAMTGDEGAPAETGAPSESSGEDSDYKHSGLLPEQQERIRGAFRVWAEFLASAKATQTLVPTGILDPRARPAVVTIARKLSGDVEWIRAGLRSAGVSDEEVQDFLGPVRRRLGPRAMRLMTATEMMNMPNPKFLVDGIVQEGSFGVLYSKPGMGKTFIVLQMCLCIAAGIPWLGRTVAQGPVVYVGAEGVGGIPKRLTALVEWADLDGPPKAPYFIDQAVNLLDLDSVADAIAAVAEMDVHPVLVVFDTYARCLIGGEENSAKDAGMAVNAIDGLRESLGTAAWVVHHTGKDSSSERGSGALRGAADAMVLLEPDSDLPGVPGALRLVNDKQKNFAAASNVHFRLTAVGDSVVPEDLGVVYAWERMAKSEDDDDEGGLRRTSAASSSRMRQDILAAATTADAEGRMPITQTDLVAPVKGNRKTKLDVLAAIVREDDSPLIMHQQGKKHLYGLRKPT